MDFLFTDNPLFKLVQEMHATTHRFLEIDVRGATKEGLILLKLFFALLSLYRQGNGQKIGLYENDIFMLYEKGRPDLEPVFRSLKPHVDAGQLTELRNIVSDIQRRIERMDRAKKPDAENDIRPPA